MGKLVLVTGGARSGKSSFAEKLAGDTGGNVLYIATAMPCDDEMKHRIERHRQGRPREWQTVEAYRALDRIIEMNSPGKSAVLLDCVTIMITNLMLEICPDWEQVTSARINSIEEQIGAEIDRFIAAAYKSTLLFVAVSNETGMGLVPEYPLSRAFRDIVGRMNQKLAQAADGVYLCVSGIPVRIK